MPWQPLKPTRQPKHYWMVSRLQTFGNSEVFLDQKPSKVHGFLLVYRTIKDAKADGWKRSELTKLEVEHDGNTRHDG